MTKSIENNILNSLLPAITTVGIMGAVMGGLNKMFGTNEIPKGVVKELMEGIMEGLIYHFQGTIDDQKREIENLQEQRDKLEVENEKLKEENQAFKDSIAEANTRAQKAKRNKV